MRSFGSVGLSASGAWRAMRSTAPIRGLDLCERGRREPELPPGGALGHDHRAEQRRLAADARQDADHDVQAVADEDRRLLVDTRDADLPRGVHAEDDDAVGAPRVAGVEEAARGQPARTARKTPGDTAFIGSWVAPAASGSLIGHRPHERPADVDVGELPAATTPLRRCRRASASHGRTALRAPPRARGADDDVGRLERVEVADDLVARRLRQAERRDERADADHRPEHGQRTRAGRASRPANASLRRSRGLIRGPGATARPR